MSADSHAEDPVPLTLRFGEMTARIEKFALGGTPILAIDGGLDDEAILSMAEARALRDWLNKVLE